MSILEVITWVLTAVGGIGLVVHGIAYWTMRLVTKRYIESVRYQNQEALEELRGEIQQSREILNSILQTSSSVSEQAQQHRIKLIQQGWEDTWDLVSYLASAEFFYSVRESEVTVNWSQPEMMQILNIIDRDGLLERSHSLSQFLAKSRPFLGERLWMLLNGYNAFLLNLGLQFLRHRQNPREDNHWSESEDLRGLVQTLIEEDIEEGVETDGIQWFEDNDSLTRHTRTAIENKISEEMTRVLNGQASAEVRLDQVDKVNEYLNQLDSSHSLRM